MRFQIVLHNLETHIFTTPPTFHGTSIGNYDLNVVECMDIKICLSGNTMMNEIMSATTTN
jgi:hypothetical protein